MICELLLDYRLDKLSYRLQEVICQSKRFFVLGSQSKTLEFVMSTKKTYSIYGDMMDDDECLAGCMAIFCLSRSLSKCSSHFHVDE